MPDNPATGIYKDDFRVWPHADGTWMVFTDDAELNVANVNGQWHAFDSKGGLVPNVEPNADRDTVIRALIGEPR